MLRRQSGVGWAAAAILVFTGAVRGPAQAPRAQLPIPVNRPSPPRPASLPHLYWHFLAYQAHLDEKAAALAKQGKDATTMRNYLQTNLGFTDADFAPIRASGGRLSTEVKALNAQAATIVTAGPTPTSRAQLQALTQQREAYVNAEVATLRQALPPAKVAAFEAFITKMFSPANATAPPAGLTGPGNSLAVKP